MSSMNKINPSFNFLKLDSINKENLIEEIKKEPLLAKLFKKLKVSDSEIWDYFNYFIDFKTQVQHPNQSPYLLNFKRDDNGKLIVEKQLAHNEKADAFRILNNLMFQHISSPFYDLTLKNLEINDNLYYDLAGIRVEILQSLDKKKKSLKQLYGVYFHGAANSYRVKYLSALANTFALNDVQVAYIDINQLDEWARQLIGNPQDIIYLVNELSKVPVLIIDEIGLKNYTEWFLESIFVKVLQNRAQNKLLTYFGSYLPLNNLAKKISTYKKGNVINTISKPLIDKLIYLIIELTKVETFIGI
ncbi:hypothetical protein [Mycoplasmopsis verecunda]|uniref:Primosomal protein DnaI n=1 Tax=Mycoplasmopsis verecunda TaxID=171291 RepID=A0A1T4KDC4_9BACT|nr:hypothetical protein [Mycoplasmopsis verecunda]WPB54859.1 hypothetical protein SAM46_01740 [Mycoplasmopsis verecunda]SJZ40345.1 primosomal protein DnaI [Mycoplasmopsis verecunda]